MAAIRSIDAIAQKWATVTPQRAGEYEQGVSNPKADWKTETLAASDAWKAGVTAAIQVGSFSKGVTRAGTSKWQTGAAGKGVQRFGPGVSLAQDDYAKSFAPYVSAISALRLPPRFARRDPRNLARVQAVVDAMVATKKRVQGGA